MRVTTALRGAVFVRQPIEHWSFGRVTLLGDAAHAMSPAGGQGASLALEDAMVVSQGLARQAPPEDAFAGAERLLRSRAQRMVKQAAENDARQLKTLGSVGQWIRDRLFPLFVPVIRRDLERQYAALERYSPGARLAA
jgi:2-polyprenyl-6-methoxyphenol hydroxylase-like FAD-dependent oxidoreductase